MVHPDGVHPHTALTREQPLSSDPLLPSPLSHPPLESVSFTAHGEKEFLRVSRSSVSDAQAGAPGAAWVCHCGPARGCPPGGALTTSGPWASVRRPWTLVRVNGEVCEKTQPASSQLQSLPLFIKEQVGSCPPPPTLGAAGEEVGQRAGKCPSCQPPPPEEAVCGLGSRRTWGRWGLYSQEEGRQARDPRARAVGPCPRSRAGLTPRTQAPAGSELEEAPNSY